MYPPNKVPDGSRRDHHEEDDSVLRVDLSNRGVQISSEPVTPGEDLALLVKASTAAADSLRSGGRVFSREQHRQILVAVSHALHACFRPGDASTGLQVES